MFLVDWAVKMRIRPPEFETSICDAKYHVHWGSWGDVARRFTMIRWAALKTAASLSQTAAAAARPRRKFVSGQLDEENPFVQNFSVLLVQADKGVSVLVVDRIGDFYRSLPRRADVIVTTVGARHKCQQGNRFERPMNDDICIVVLRIDHLPALFYVLPLPRRGADPDTQQLLHLLIQQFIGTTKPVSVFLPLNIPKLTSSRSLVFLILCPSTW
ncbi:hypothetical protein F511_13575 [Dorcoceras hygrometricum]|uniref:Uncharacterized protein n=1 Tax=Dorcoceras hygrometricum TaxID=472368 RepID=A0A2Z7CY32_9LAMI|nr:hypothetical protein F511_13575 [Dorcoceras hygrometricum]